MQARVSQPATHRGGESPSAAPVAVPCARIRAAGTAFVAIGIAITITCVFDRSAAKAASAPPFAQASVQDPATRRPSGGASSLPDTLTTLSRSAQFVVTGRRPASVGPVVTRAPGDPERELTPQTLAPSCERVKAEILRILELPDRWRSQGGETGRILVFIEPRRSASNTLAVAASPFETGWHVRVSLPPVLTEDRLVRTLTQAILLELASRQGNQRAGDPPLWLVEGMTQMILADAPEGITFRPQTRTIADLRVGTRLQAVREQLSKRPPLSFHEISQPNLSAMQPLDWAHYSACAHLCLRQLTRLPDGPQRLARWLSLLQSHWNWQTGFLEAFDPTFRSLLDLEKWWAVNLAHITGRNMAQTWPADFSLRKLEEVLRPVGVLPDSGHRAVRLELEDVIQRWEFPRQVPVLQRLLQQLHSIRINAPPEVSLIAARYAAIIDEYLDDRRRIGFAPTGHGQPILTARLVVRGAVGSLRALDGERSRLAESESESKRDSQSSSGP